jgi:ribosome biogenesis SPOUT family RNA methylase Rps3
MPSEPKKFKFIIEHMEPEVSGWPELEYKNMQTHVDLQLVVPSSLLHNIPSSLDRTEVTTVSVNQWPAELQKRVLLLDPSSPDELVPSDATDYDFLLFGGILGDDPPQDRTKMLREMGFATRHLGPIQMTTDVLPFNFR